MADQPEPTKEQRDNELGQRIHDLRVFNAWTRPDLAEALYLGAKRGGIDHPGHKYAESTLWRWEAGKMAPSAGALKLIWAVSGVSWKWLSLGIGTIDAADSNNRPE